MSGHIVLEHGRGCRDLCHCRGEVLGRCRDRPYHSHLGRNSFAQGGVGRLVAEQAGIQQRPCQKDARQRDGDRRCTAKARRESEQAGPAGDAGKQGDEEGRRSQKAPGELEHLEKGQDPVHRLAGFGGHKNTASRDDQGPGCVPKDVARQLSGCGGQCNEGNDEQHRTQADRVVERVGPADICCERLLKDSGQGQEIVEHVHAAGGESPFDLDRLTIHEGRDDKEGRQPQSQCCTCKLSSEQAGSVLA